MAGSVVLDDEDPIVMMEKDAAKVWRLKLADVPLNCWYLEIDAAMTEDAEAELARCRTTRRIVAPHLTSAEA